MHRVKVHKRALRLNAGRLPQGKSEVKKEKKEKRGRGSLLSPYMRRPPAPFELNRSILLARTVLGQTGCQQQQSYRSGALLL